MLCSSHNAGVGPVGWGQRGGASGVGPKGWGQWGGASGAGPVGRGGASLYTCALVHEICTSYTYSCVCVRACEQT